MLILWQKNIHNLRSVKITNKKTFCYNWRIRLRDLMMFYKFRLYHIVIVSIVSAILFSMGFYVTHLYEIEKKRLHDEMLSNVQMTLNSLQKSILHFIEAYEVQEYEMVIANEMRHKDFSAIVVNGLNLANILGESSHYRGKIQQINAKIEDFDPKNPTHRQLLLDAYFSKQTTITIENKAIATITIYATDFYIHQALRIFLTESIIAILLFSALIAGILFVLLAYFVIKPLNQIIMQLIHRDDHNAISPYKIEENSIYEFSALSQAIHDYIKREKEYHTALRLEQEIFRIAIEGIQDGVWDWNLVSNTVFFSRQWKEMLGYREDEIGNHFEEWSKRIHPDDLKSTMKLLQSHLDGETQRYESKYRLQHKDGSWKWIFARSKALFDENKKALRVIGVLMDISRQVAHEKALDYSAKHDPLTALPNRLFFEELLEKMLIDVFKNNTKVALFYLDLDGFKEINDTYGHNIGDEVLIKSSQRMSYALRYGDIIARLGGDEFVIAIGNVISKEDIIIVLKQLLKDINEPIFIEKIHSTVRISVSIGVSLCSEKKKIDTAALLRQADQAMYSAKNSGKNQYQFSPSFDSALF